MRWISRYTLAAATAAMLATAVVAPADARRYRHWDRDSVDFGDLVVGAIVIGGIAVLASEIAKARENNGTVFGNDRKRGANSESAAVDACSSAAERRARDEGRSGRVRDIGDVERLGDTFRVRGTIEYRSSRDWGDPNRDRRDEGRRGQDYWDSARFTCSYSYGRVDYVRLEDNYAWR